MNSQTQKHRVGAWGMAGTSALAMILVAAASEHDASWERLRAMPPGERTRLLDNLRKFDLELTPEQQSSLRELDRRLSELSPDRRAQYEAVLRRYHNWLNSLPENRQAELVAKPAGERLALIRKLISEWPVPGGETQPLLRVIEAGELSAFEVASAYKIWQALSATQRARLDHLNEHGRRDVLLNQGPRLKPAIPRETRPEDYDEQRWIGQVQDYLHQTRPILLAEEAVRKRLEDAAKKKGELMDETAKKRLEDAVKKAEAGRREFLKRLAVNLYVSHAVSRPEFRTVDSERLARFVSGLPAWLQTSFDPLPPDEARRRLSLAYRLVFPHPEEIGSPKKSADKASKAPSAPARKPSPPARSKLKPSESGGSSTPF